MRDDKLTPAQLKRMNPRELADVLYRGTLRYVRAHYKRHKVLDPFIFALDADFERFAIALPPFEEGFSREVLTGLLRHHLHGARAIAYCFVMEMYMRAPSTHEEIEKVKALVEQGHVFGVSQEIVRLTESYPRREILAFNIAVPGLKELKWFFIHRDKKGRLASLGEPDTTFLASEDSWLLSLLDAPQTTH